VSSLYVAGGDTLPARLRDLCRYVLWRYEPRFDRGGKPTKQAKVPYQIDGCTNAKINDPTTWAPFDDAYRALASPELAERGFGIGLVLGHGFSGIDLDGVHNAETGQLAPWAFDLTMRFGSYTEISPSGTGLHILFQEATGGAACKLGDKVTREGFEYYSGDRFFTVTGAPYALSPPGIYSIAPDFRAEICAEMHAKFGKEPKTGSAQYLGDDGSSERADDEVLRMMFTAQNGEEMERLYFGVGPTVGDGTDSDADWALAKGLAFWTGRKREQIERLMRASGCNRSKWDHPRGEMTWLARTIERACNATDKTYGVDLNGSRNGRALYPNGATAKSNGSCANDEIKSTPIAEIKIEPQNWLWRYRIPDAQLTMFEGDGGVGKSTVVLDLIARVTTGRPLPGGGPKTKIGPVLIFADEDSQSMIRARLQVAGADLALVEIVTGIGEDRRRFIVPNDCELLKAKIAQKPWALIYIDAVFDHFAPKSKPKDPQDCRMALSPLRTVAIEAKTPILCIRHWGKGTGAAKDRGLGSSEITHVARGVLCVAPHPEDATLRVIATAKKNYAPHDTPSLTYRICSAPVLDPSGTPILDDEGELFEVGRIEWVGEADLSADDLSNQIVMPEDASQAAGTREWLTDLLSNGPLSRVEILAAGKKDGYARTTICAAKSRLKIVSSQGGFPNRAIWTLPSQLSHPRVHETTDTTETTGSTGTTEFSPVVPIVSSSPSSPSNSVRRVRGTTIGENGATALHDEEAVVAVLRAAGFPLLAEDIGARTHLSRLRVRLALTSARFWKMGRGASARYDRAEKVQRLDALLRGVSGLPSA
jgi:hypothetical protein